MLMAVDTKTRRRLESLCLDLASEAELEAVAEYAQGEQQREARRLLRERCQEMAARAARDLRAALTRVWPGWEQAL